MRILLIAATTFEVQPLISHLQEAGNERSPLVFLREKLQLEVLITGVGLPLAAFALGHRLGQEKYDLLIQAGVAGAFDRSLRLGQVVEVVSDCFGDLGVEEADGSFTNLTAMDLLPADAFPFKSGRLWNKGSGDFNFLPKVHGISVNKVHGHETAIEQFRALYPFAQVETMEGASFFYACLQHGIPALQIRGISNYVEKRQRENWKLKEAITALNEVLSGLIETLENVD